MKVSATEFQQNVGKYQDAALQGPVTITKNGRDHIVMISADFFKTVLKGRVVRRTSELDEATLRAIAAAEVDAKYAYLDAELED